jgi:formate hydrogenlyase subunit 3/multisubunit Na+/H+ antiporter MnhD subunit
MLDLRDGAVAGRARLARIYLLVLIVTHVRAAGRSAQPCAGGNRSTIDCVMIAMVQHNLKKLLSYHAISQVGYMVWALRR